MNCIIIITINYVLCHAVKGDDDYFNARKTIIVIIAILCLFIISANIGWSVVYCMWLYLFKRISRAVPLEVPSPLQHPQDYQDKNEDKSTSAKQSLSEST